MKKTHSHRLWWVPLLLVAAPVFGWVPGHRDLIDFFSADAPGDGSMLATAPLPWLNLANGCGEAWFANPETAVLYPPAWLHLVFPADGPCRWRSRFHLAWLSLGAGLVAHALGAGRRGRWWWKLWRGRPVP